MTVPAVAAPFMASAALLGFAGVAKAVQPAYTARALQFAVIRAGRHAVRAGAAAEVLIAIAAFASPGAITGALVAASYSAFAVFVAVALNRGWPLSSCGCFGRKDSVPTRAHLVLNVGAASSAVVWAIGAPSDLPDALKAQPWGGWPLVVVSLVVALAAYIVWTNPLAGARKQ